MNMISLFINIAFSAILSTLVISLFIICEHNLNYWQIMIMSVMCSHLFKFNITINGCS